MGRNPDLQSSGPRTDALGDQNQSMYYRGNQSFGSQPSMPSMPNQSKQRQRNFGNNMPRPTMPGNDHQPLQRQSGQMSDSQLMMANSSGLSMIVQANQVMNNHGQHVPDMQQNHVKFGRHRTPWQTTTCHRQCNRGNRCTI